MYRCMKSTHSDDNELLLKHCLVFLVHCFICNSLFALDVYIVSKLALQI